VRALICIVAFCVLPLLAGSMQAQEQTPPTPRRIILKMDEHAGLSFTTQGGVVLPPAAAAVLDGIGMYTVTPMLPAVSFRKGADEFARFVFIDTPEHADLPSLIAELERTPGITYAVQDRLYRLHTAPNDSAWASQWGTQRIQTTKAWEVTRGRKDVVVGVIDTGIDLEHPDLLGQIWINEAEDINGDGLFQPWPSTEFRDGISGDLDGIDNDGNGFIDDVIGYDFVDQRDVSNAAGGDYRDPDPIPEDEMGHGTSVSGIIAATADNGIGIAGVAPGCRVMVLRAFDARGYGAESDVSRALAYAVANGAHVINMSFGDVVYSRVLRDVIRYAYARGVVMVASAGNSQSAELHYPSAYSETISVSATTSGDNLAGFSNFGQTIDLAAPGADIVTTDLDGRYSSFYGTSASAPFVSAVAALLLSRDDRLTPEEVRGILVASAEDLGARGWDERFGAGLLRADRALALEHPSVLRITTPRTDFATNQDSIVVLGTAASPVMTGYQMMYGIGVDPRRWIDITPVIPRQVVADTLCVWNTSQLPDTTYTLRLAAISDKGTTLDHRVILRLDRTPPVIREALLLPALDGNAYGISVGFITDEATLGKVWYRLKGSSQPWTWVSAEPSTRNNLFVGRMHSIFLGPDLFTAGRAYEFYISAENAVGLESILRDERGNNFELTVPAPVSTFGYDRVLPSLPTARLYGGWTDMNGNGRPEILLNNLADDGAFQAWEYNGMTFDRVDSGAQRNEIPRGAGDVTGDGRTELLTSIVRNGFLYSSEAQGAWPSTRIWGDSSGGNFWPVGIHDVTGDGKMEVLAIRNDSTVGVYRWDGSGLALFADIINPTGAPRSGNSFSAPRVAIGDFNNNGRRNLLFGDADGDFFIAEYNGAGGFPIIWASENDFVNASDFVAAGDFTGDGRQEFVAGFRTDVEDVLPFWFVGIFRLDSQNRAEALWTGQFHGVAESSQYGSFTRIQNSITVGNIDDDPADELIITTFPELYIIDYDPVTREFEPVFFLPLVNTNAAVITDVDGDGINEFAIALTDSVVWYRANVEYQGPEAPRSISTVYVSPSSLRIEWTVGSPAPEYRLYKGEDASSMQRTGTFPGIVSLVDNDIEANRPTLYAITAFDPERTPQESPRRYSRLLLPHALPSVDSLRYAQSGQILIYVSEEMGELLPSPSHFLLDRRTEPQSVALLDQRTLLLSFGELADGSYGLEVRGLRTGEGIPFEDQLLGPINVSNPVVNECFIERVDYTPPRTLRVRFSSPVDAVSASQPGNYEIQPVGFASTATPDADDAHVVLLDVTGDRPIGALGREYVLKVRNVRCASGAMIGDGPGSTAGIVLNRQTLDDAFVYPNPLRPSDGQSFVTFANLTPQAVIRVYSVSGMFIREIVEDDGNGGVEWDLLDSDGRALPGGVYLFRATGSDINGKEVAPKLGKFAIIR
jgi:subtilisin family serine protease